MPIRNSGVGLKSSVVRYLKRADRDVSVYQLITLFGPVGESYEKSRARFGSILRKLVHDKKAIRVKRSVYRFAVADKKASVRKKSPIDSKQEARIHYGVQSRIYGVPV